MTPEEEETRLNPYSSFSAASSSRPSLASHIESLRSSAFPPTHPIRQDVYLDSASAPPVPTALFDEAHRYLTRGDGVNLTSTHSLSPSGRHTSRQIDEARRRVCADLFGVQWSTRSTGASEPREGWDLVFTSGATASLQLATRSLSFHGGRFAYTTQAHSSVVGLRDIVAEERSNGPALVDALDLTDLQSVMTWVDDCYSANRTRDACSLLCLPLQCNATGKRYLDVVSQVLKRRHQHEIRQPGRQLYILLDAAAYLSSARMDLGKLSTRQAPDFVAFSMYKVLGTPTGVGGLLIQQRSGLDVLLPGKKYFGGGALDFLIPSANGARIPASASLHQAFEDGSPNVQAVATVPSLLDRLERPDLLQGDWRAGEEYVSWLQALLHTRLSGLRHDCANGGLVCRMYSQAAAAAAPSHEAHSLSVQDFTSACGSTEQGPTILFNILLPASRDGQQAILDPNEVARLAAVEGIHLRSGRMCNVGAVSHALGISEAELTRQWEMGVGCAGLLTGSKEQTALPATAALRLSLCVWNTEDDVNKFVTFVRTFFQMQAAETGVAEHDEKFFDCMSGPAAWISPEEDNGGTNGHQSPSPGQASCRLNDAGDQEAFRISSLHLYPIKSCASQDIPKNVEWPITASGLLYDRQFGIVSLENGKVLSQKRHPRMARIKPRVDVETGTMEIQLMGSQTINSITVPLEVDSCLQSPVTGDSSSCFDLCGSQIKPVLFTQARVHEALSAFLQTPCALVRLPPNSARTGLTTMTPILFSNESPFLMINRQSVLQVCRWVRDKHPTLALDEARVAAAFRANIVIDVVGHEGGGRESKHHDECFDDESVASAFAEDSADRVTLGHTTFGVLGPCRRCEMVALDQHTGEPRPEILKAVATHRRCRSGRYSGKILFGSHLEMIQREEVPSPAVASVQIGMNVRMTQLQD